MTNPTLNQAVQQLLQQGLGGNAPAFQQLMQDIDSSPDLINQLNSDVGAGFVKTFSWSNQVGSGAAYNSGTDTLYINVNQLLSANAVTEVSAIGHELGHSEFDNESDNPAGLTDSQALQYFQNDINDQIASGNSDFTTAINSVQANFNYNEAYAQIKGFDDALSSYYTQYPDSSVTDAYSYLSQNSGYSSYFLLNGSILPGFTTNADGSISETLANMGAEGDYYFLNSPNTLSIFGDKNYANNYGTSELGQVIDGYLTNSGDYDVNGSQLTITPTIKINFSDISASNDGNGSFDQSFDPNLLAQDMGRYITSLPNGATSVSFTVEDTSTGTSYVYTVNNGVSSVTTTAPGSTPLVYVGDSAPNAPTVYQANASNSVVTIAAGYTGDIDGSNDTDILGNGSMLVTLAGDSDNTVTCGGSSATFNGASADTCSITQAGNSLLTIDGSGLTGTLQGNVVLTESGDTFGAGSNSNVTMASGDTINVGADTSGVQLTCGSATEMVNGGAAAGDSVQCAIDDNGNGTFTNSGNDITISTSAGSSATVNGNDDLINAGAGSATLVNGNGSTVNEALNSDSSINFGNYDSDTANGSGITVDSGYGDSLTFGSVDTSDTVNGSNGTFAAGDGAVLLINGSSDTYNGGFSNTVSFNGNNDTANLAANSGSVVNFEGSNQIGAVDGAGNLINIGASGDSINASGETIDFTSGGDNTSIYGNNNVINTGSDSQTTLGGSGDVVNLIDNSGSSVDVNNYSNATLDGAGEDVGLGYGASAILNVDANDSNAASDETISVWNSHITVNGDDTDLTINGSGAQVTAGDDITALINANSTTFTGGSDDTVIFGGTGETANLMADGGSTVNFDAASQSGTVNGVGNLVNIDDSGDSINASGETIDFTSGGDSTSIYGNNNVINAGSDSQTTLGGGGDVVNLIDGSGSSVNVNNYSNATLNGAGEDIGLGYGASAILNVDANGGNAGAGSDEIINVWNSQVTVNGDDTDLTINGSGAQVTGGGDDITVIFDGPNGTANLTADSGSTVNFDAANQNGTVNGVGNLVNIGNTGDSINTSGETIDFTNGGDSTSIYGSSNVINAGADSQTTLGGAGDVVNLIDNSGSTVNVNNYDNATLNGAGESVGLGYGASAILNVDANGSDAGVGSNETISVWNSHITVNGDDTDLTINGNGAQVTAGDDITALINANSTTFTGGGDDTLTFGGTGETANLTADGGSTVNFDAANQSGTVSGAGNLISIGGSGDNITASNETVNFSGNGDNTTIDGNSNVINAGADSQTTLSGGGDIVNLIDDTGSSVNLNGYSNATINGAGDSVYVGYYSSATLNLDANSPNGAEGSSDMLNMSYYANATVNGDGEDLTINGSSDRVTAGDDITGVINGGSIDYTGGTDNTLSATGSGDTFNLTANGDNTVDFAGSLNGTVNGSGNLVNVQGSGDEFNMSGETVDFTGSGDNTTIDGNNNVINAGVDSQTTIGGSDDVINVADGSGSSVDLNGYSSATVSGSDLDINTGYQSSLTLAVGDKDVTVDGGNTSIDASKGTSMTVDGGGDVITANGTTIDLSSNEQVTIDGSNDVIVGGSNDTITVDGLDDGLTATDSSVTFDGADSGDSLSGSGDSWSDPGEGTGGTYLNSGGYYGYGYGLTKMKGKNPSAQKIAAAEHSDSVYEGAAWADKTVTWSFASVGGSFSDAITNPQEQAAVEQAFQAWAKASGLHFQEVASGSHADIEIGFNELNSDTTNEIGLTTYKSQAGNFSQVQVQLEDPNQVALATNANGEIAYSGTDATFEQVALHEIGHALGLADTDMTGSIMNAVLGSDNQTLNTIDLGNIQALYGGGTSSSGESGLLADSQVHQLIQAMSTFDSMSVEDTGANPLHEAQLYREHLSAGLHASAHAV